MVYNDDHPGIQILPSEGLVAELLTLDATTIKGYFSKQDLTLLLNQIGCVGIRVYNLYDIEDSENPLHINRGIIAAGVLSTGFEIENGAYIQSHHSSSSSHLENAQNLSRIDAKSEIMSQDFDVDDAFASFFSTAMINSLLSDSNTTGLAFYTYKLTDPLAPPMIMFNSALKTHVGTPVVINSDGTLPTAFQPDGMGFIPHLISDQPCPGHCAKREVLDTGIEHVTVTPIAIDSDPYLFDWHSA